MFRHRKSITIEKGRYIDAYCITDSVQTKNSFWSPTYNSVNPAFTQSVPSCSLLMVV